MSRSVHILNTKWLSTTGDRNELAISFEVVSSQYLGRSDEGYYVSSHVITVGISGTLVSVWGIRGRALEAQLVEYAKRYIADKLIEGTLEVQEKLELSTYNAPDQPLFRISLENFYIPTGFGVEEPEYPAELPEDHSLGSSISTLRDNINAIFGDKFGGKLLGITQERAISDLSKQSSSEEEFVYRVTSLCGLATSINTDRLPDIQDGGSLNRLGLFLRSEFQDEAANSIMDGLTAFNRLRRMYPVHTDRAGGVMEAFAFFGIGYPVKDYELAWTKLRMKYKELLEQILSLLTG
jgi:hypothetical protein